MIQNLFLPIKSVNLAHYFMKGCVCPTLYLNNRNDDIQSKEGNFLLLTTEKFTNDTNCALEIVLTENEKQFLQRYSTDYYLFSMPLPISRVKKIIFSDQEVCDNTCFNIESGAAFLPQELIHVEQKSLYPNKVIETSQLVTGDNQKSNKTWHNEIDTFNRILGGFTIMQATSIDLDDYPLNYFYSLSLFNKKIDRDFKNLEMEGSNNYQWLFEKNSEKNKYRQFRKFIFNKIEASIVEASAIHDKVDLKTTMGKYAFEDIDPSTTTYTLAILASYDLIGARMTLDNFISDLVANKFPSQKKEPLALTFGINKGYSAFRNSYKTKNFDIDIKFKLDSQLDYYTIESIYQFAFNDKVDNESFEYIDDWCPRFKSKGKFESHETGLILDRIVRLKKKETKTIFSNNFSKDIFQNISRYEIYRIISTEIAKWSPPYLNPNDDACIDHFSQLLEDYFEQYTSDVYDKIKATFEKDSNDKLIHKQSEIDELKITLDLQQKEISELKCENEELKQTKPNENILCKVQSNDQYILDDMNTFEKREFKENDLSKKTVKQLRILARDIGISSSRLKKDDLIHKILKLEFK